ASPGRAGGYEVGAWLMKIVRYRNSKGEVQHGRLHAEGPTTRLAGDLYHGFTDTGEAADVAKLLAPVEPVGILCIGLNYAEHAAEGGKPCPEFPVLFMKTASAVQHPGDPVRLPRGLRSDRVDYECELVVVIGRDCKNATQENALGFVAGYTCGNDISARDWQSKWGGGQFCRGKTFDTFAPLGPCLVTPDEITDPNNLRLQTRLNGQTMQDSSTADMIFSVKRLIEFLSGSTTLRAGTVLFTGTPPGVGFARQPPVWLQPGDVVEVEIEGIGVLKNPVIEEEISVL
ncbi:MAG: fumarylacetoacetate hydrolase family protein, partial [Planctomycetales bacterium]|nr:fumarylacetoacetate hydrolase family protein [Planctomycetales bacterium]